MKLSPEYIAELHKFLYLSNDSDEDRLQTNVTIHLRSIPHKKLYRYRKCNDRELGMPEENPIWLSNHENFPDLFNATRDYGEIAYTVRYAKQQGLEVRNTFSRIG